MKSLLLLLWLATAGVAYYFYNDGQDSRLQARLEANVQDEKLAAESRQKDDLKAKLEEADKELSEVKKQLLEAKAAAAASTPPPPPAVETSASAPTESQTTPPPNFPSQITTSDGKSYTAVKVIKFDAARVTILDSDGGATLLISTLPADAQKLLGYDPDRARDALAKDEADDAASEKALEQERLQRSEAVAAATNSPTPAFESPPSTPVTASKPTLTADQIASIRSQITYLQDDIAFMQREEDKVSGGYNHQDGNRVTSGGYAQKISEEEGEIQALKEQLNN